MSSPPQILSRSPRNSPRADTGVSGPGLSNARRGERDDHIFFSALAIFASAAIIIGFSHSYYLKEFTGAPPLPLFVHVHAAIFTSWLVLFITQTTLIARHRVDLHRKLGLAGGALAAVMVIVGLTTAILAAKSGYVGTPALKAPNAESFLIVPLRDMLVFSIFVGTALYFRRNPQRHKRLMLLALLGGLLGAGVTRLPVASHHPPAIGVIMLAFLLACPLYDFARHRRVYPSYILGAIVSLVLVPPVLVPLAGTSHSWKVFAEWIMRL